MNDARAVEPSCAVGRRWLDVLSVQRMDHTNQRLDFLSEFRTSGSDPSRPIDCIATSGPGMARAAFEAVDPSTVTGTNVGIRVNG